jgi:hypothetical protein
MIFSLTQREVSIKEDHLGGLYMYEFNIYLYTYEYI